LKNHDENAKRKSEKSGRKSYSKWGMQDVYLYAQIPFHLARMDNRPFPIFWKLIPHFEPIIAGIKHAIVTIETIGNTETTNQKTIRATKAIRYQ
jgi:hypothetical protein